MLNTVWAVLLCSGLVAGFLKGSFGAVASAILASTGSAVETLLGIAGGICFWSGLMRIAEESGLASSLGRAVRLFVRPLFPGLKPWSKAHELVALNISANLLGVGNAATPLGLKAMVEMAQEQGCDEASDEMCTLVVFNTAGPSLVPGSLVALRASMGSARPDAIVGPAFVAACCATSAALIADVVFRRARRAST